MRKVGIVFVINLMAIFLLTISSYSFLTDDQLKNGEFGLTKQECDYDNDGTIDSVSIYTYDSSGNVIKKEYDEKNDGTINDVFIYTYDSSGNKIKEENYYDGAMTKIDSVQTYTYDSYGNIIKEEIDRYIDGTIDIVWTYAWERIIPNSDDDGSSSESNSDHDSSSSGCFILSIFDFQ